MARKKSWVWEYMLQGKELKAGKNKVWFFFGKKHLLTISEAFNWDKKSGWNEFWRRCEKRVGEELQFYELFTRANLEDRSEAISVSET
ncbi:hypothetical protein M422DRAFT_35481 [Sphaerobolus stellatus SS14]|uniref:Uncharacterized protein n=1 Tax=Sphaerobolus stellatus (strain SS14) TaxID=990650 RepID=A0A0C9TTF0_SPHS4|nr:hypothetical protein M422DRAFT_35481 [Sphaerobolus stellatus SS14]